MNLYDEISRVAYEIWLKKGMPVGCDMENWLEAEQIVYSTLRQNNETTVESVNYSVTTLISMPEPGTESNVDTSQPTPDSETAEAPKKRRGPYKKRTSVAAPAEKKVSRGRKASKDKSPEKKLKRGRKKKTETSEGG